MESCSALAPNRADAASEVTQSRMLPMAPGAAYAPLKPRERVQIIASCLVLVVFGAVILIRSCFLESRLTDVGCYLRAGWAVRAAKDPYAVTDIHYWHFAYP